MTDEMFLIAEKLPLVGGWWLDGGLEPLTGGEVHNEYF